MLVCPWHAWEFDCVTGESDFLPAAKLKTYPVTVDGDDVLIEIE
jgi:nitrite reductase/ring-hydroxylating ferredoxin subunit